MPAPRSIRFRSGAFDVDALLYMPDAVVTASPAIVLGLGTANLKEWFGDFAEAFVAAGFAVLAFDYPHWGGSSGEPRQHIDPWAQIEACRDALSWLEGEPGIDPDRIGIWGSSGGGGNVLVAAAIDRRFKAVVAQIPLVYIHDTAKMTMSAEQRGWIAGAGEAERRQVARGGAPGYIALVDPDPAVPSFLSDPKSKAWLHEMATATPDWRNQLTIASLDKVMTFAPEAYAERIAVPTRLIVARNDDLTPASLAESFAARIPARHDIVWIEGTHLAPFFDEKSRAIAAACDWFATTL